ncbi:MAG: amidohydrolase family protein [Candidatus Eisenbacteria bacterium]|uniref:Amidohydrolase family protein n=1 Tax=Eiseniibacteriota bacterium TaxID=2212470 RepID=A0A948RYZ4_UNCEI|nr:amidohydrolase family protein [Candidatus Eisenbacteria bacterium]MBU1947956.1 amidohydrolase family protein [Candidatus Eisenbacteria bacterium]MBU2693420.1 amidohydrolase family protein [Candidatus Eisenbacteria bacterium]
MLRLKNIHIFHLSPTWEVIHGDLEIDAGRISAIGSHLPEPGPGTEVMDLEGAWVLPGFVQSHIHLCQTLFRGMAEDLPLHHWLKNRIWPLEAAHTEASLEASARLGALELISSGTTAVLDMGTVHHTERIGLVLEEMGLSGVIGKALMDTGEGVPEGLIETTDAAISSAVEIGKAWDGRGNGTIRASLAPRFILSVSRKAWKRIGEIQEGRGWRIHTHACETPWENKTSRKMIGRTPIAYFESRGLLGTGMTLAHVIWIGRREVEWLAASGTRVAHCPSSNLKLGSGLADIGTLRSAGVAVGLGCDGAACSNSLNMFEEMRRSLLVSSIRSGPGVLTARHALEMATLGGARALGWDDEIGRLEEGRRADLIALWPWGDPSDHTDPHDVIVQEGDPLRVRQVYMAGRRIYCEGEYPGFNPADIIGKADEERRALLQRLGWKPSSIPVRTGGIHYRGDPPAGARG